MESFKVRWTERGEVRTSVVSYDEKSAKDRVASFEARNLTAEYFPVKPGERL